MNKIKLTKHQVTIYLDEHLNILVKRLKKNISEHPHGV